MNKKTKQMQSFVECFQINRKISAVVSSHILYNARSTPRSDCVSSGHHVTLVFCRTITSTPYNRAINVIKHAEFITSNNIITARCRLYLKAGNPISNHKPAINEGDTEKLGQYFTQWRSNPDILVEATWFHLCFYFFAGAGNVGLPWQRTRLSLSRMRRDMSMWYSLKRKLQRTKHKSTTGLLPYLSDLSNSEKRECSSALTKVYCIEDIGPVMCFDCDLCSVVENKTFADSSFSAMYFLSM